MAVIMQPPAGSGSSTWKKLRRRSRRGLVGAFLKAVARGQSALHAEHVCRYLNPLMAGQPGVFAQAVADCLNWHLLM